MVKLITMDGESVIVENEIASKSRMLKDIVEYSGDDDEIYVTMVKKDILLKIVDYCTYINTNPPPIIQKPIRTNEIGDVVSPWFAEFVNIDKEVLFELILAANYLDIKSLFELSCAKVAILIKGMTIK